MYKIISLLFISFFIINFSYSMNAALMDAAMITRLRQGTQRTIMLHDAQGGIAWSSRIWDVETPIKRFGITWAYCCEQYCEDSAGNEPGIYKTETTLSWKSKLLFVGVASAFTAFYMKKIIDYAK